MSARYSIEVEVVPGLLAGECFALLPTRDGRACVALSGGEMPEEGRLPVSPARMEGDWILVEIPSSREPRPQAWVSTLLLRLEEAAGSEGGSGADMWGEAVSSAAVPAADPAPEEGPARDGERAYRRTAAPSLVVGETAACIRNISLGGISLDRVPARPLGDRYRLVLTDIFENDSCELEAAVVWCHLGRMGLRWVSLAPEQRGWLERQLGERPEGTQQAVPPPEEKPHRASRFLNVFFRPA